MAEVSLLLERDEADLARAAADEGGDDGVGRGACRRSSRNAERDPGHASLLPLRRLGVLHQPRAVPPEGHHRALPRHRRRHQGVRHHRAGARRAARQREAGGAAALHRGGRGHHALPQPQARGRAEDGAHARQPAARPGRPARARAADGLARAPGATGRGVPSHQGASCATSTCGSWRRDARPGSTEADRPARARSRRSRRKRRRSSRQIRRVARRDRRGSRRSATANAERLRAVEEELTERAARARPRPRRASAALAARREELTRAAAEAERRGRAPPRAPGRRSRPRKRLVEPEVARLAAEEPAGPSEHRRGREPPRDARRSRSAARARRRRREGRAARAPWRTRHGCGTSSRRSSSGGTSSRGGAGSSTTSSACSGERLHGNAARAEAARAAIARLRGRARRASVTNVSDAGRGAAERWRERGERAGSRCSRRRARRRRDLRSRAESLRELQARYEGCTRGVASLLAPGRRGRAAAGERAARTGGARAGGRGRARRRGSDRSSSPTRAAAVDAIGWLRRHGGRAAPPSYRATPSDARPVIVPPGRRLVDQIDVDPAALGARRGAPRARAAGGRSRRCAAPLAGAEHAVTVVTPAGEAIDALGAVSGRQRAAARGDAARPRARAARARARRIAAAHAVVTGEEGALGVLRAEGAAIATTVADRRGAAPCGPRRSRGGREGSRTASTRSGRVSRRELEVGALEAGGLAGEDGELAGEVVAASTHAWRPQGRRSWPTASV